MLGESGCYLGNLGQYSVLYRVFKVESWTTTVGNFALDPHGLKPMGENLKQGWALRDDFHSLWAQSFVHVGWAFKVGLTCKSRHADAAYVHT